MRYLIALFALLLAFPAAAAPIIGQPAPAFTGKDTLGNDRSLATYLGKTVVLEWTNHECPYVKKHYDSGNMQKTQEEAARDGVIWLRIISSGEGQQGYVMPEQANRIIAEEHAVATATLLDTTGDIGRAYAAKTTPHMFVIDPNGVLVYGGAIDDKPTSDVADVATAKNYVKTVLDDLKAGRPVSVGETKSYGCGVKYGTAESVEPAVAPAADPQSAPDAQ